MGLFSKKTKTTTNQTATSNQTSTATPLIQDWIANPIQDLTKKVGETYGNFDPSKLVPGPTALQRTAATSAANFGAPPAYSMAQNLLGEAGSAGAQNVGKVDIAGYIPNFLNPYLKDVVDTSLSDYDFGAGQTRAQDQLARAGDSTFGGSSGAIQTALSNARLAAGRGSLAAGLRSDAYDKAAALAGQQAGFDNGTNMANANFAENALTRKLNAGTGLTSLGTSVGADARANAGAQFDIGEALRQIKQGQNTAPLDLLTKQIASLTGLPLDMFSGQTTNTNGTVTQEGTSTSKTSGASLGDWLKLAASAAMAASDGRLKQDVKTVGYDAKGRRWVDFAYTWDPETTHRGVIAQEVRKTDPDAVVEGPSGILFVDYSKLQDA